MNVVCALMLQRQSDTRKERLVMGESSAKKVEELLELGLVSL